MCRKLIDLGYGNFVTDDQEGHAILAAIDQQVRNGEIVVNGVVTDANDYLDGMPDELRSNFDENTGFGESEDFAQYHADDEPLPIPHTIQEIIDGQTGKYPANYDGDPDLLVPPNMADRYRGDPQTRSQYGSIDRTPASLYGGDNSGDNRRAGSSPANNQGQIIVNGYGPQDALIPPTLVF